jgi:hypothetical protein
MAWQAAWSKRFWPMGLLALLLGVVSGEAAAQAVPQYAPNRHLGVETCKASGCHEPVPAGRAGNPNIAQNEYSIWSQRDRHASAYKVLFNERSRRIARNLGLGAAHEAKICVDCHAHNPPADRRGPQFKVSDGVSCEACHGGAEQWLGPHIFAGGNRQQSISAGLYPTEEPVRRAKLCLSCHFGDANKWITHRIMGAGHPQLRFELDTYTAIEPAHYKVDEDYVKRKPRGLNGVQVWAVGQAMAVSELMAAVADPRRNRDGIFPELVLFDCQSCHHAMSNLRWSARASTGLKPGIPRITDANIIMLRVAAERAAPSLAAQLKERSLRLHQASTQGMEATAAAARALKETADGLVSAFAGRGFGRDDAQALMMGLLDEGLRRGELIDFTAAEQATLALGTLMIATGRSGELRQAHDRLLALTLSDDNFRPDSFRAALAQFQAAAGRGG